MTVEQHERELNQMILEGRAIETFERFYDDNVQMQENLAAPTAGLAANVEREKGMWNESTKINEIRLLRSAVAGDVSFSEWLFDVTLGNGYRIHMTEVSRREWKDGKVVHERFYYDPKPAG